jgi:hypothetical protein
LAIIKNFRAFRPGSPYNVNGESSGTKRQAVPVESGILFDSTRGRQRRGRELVQG